MTSTTWLLVCVAGCAVTIGLALALLWRAFERTDERRGYRALVNAELARQEILNPSRLDR